VADGKMQKLKGNRRQGEFKENAGDLSIGGGTSKASGGKKEESEKRKLVLKNVKLAWFS